MGILNERKAEIKFCQMCGGLGLIALTPLLLYNQLILGLDSMGEGVQSQLDEQLQ